MPHLGVAIFRRKPKSFEANAIASCQRLRPSIDWKHDRKDDQITGDGITINLTNLRLVWEETEEDQRAIWLEGHLSEVLFRIEAPTESLDETGIRALIRPRVLVESARLDTLINRRSTDTIVAHQHLATDLVGVLGLDSETSIELISQPLIEESPGEFQDYWQRGIANVSALPVDPGWSKAAETVFISNIRDDYTNSRLLDPTYLDQLGLSGPAVVLLPHRNSLIVAPLIDDNAVMMACELALEELEAPSPICSKPFVFDRGELTPLVAGPEHPAYKQISMLRLIDDDINYRQMQPQLTELVAGELKVGAFFVDADRRVSSANWGPASALLPKTDEIVFIDDEVQPARGMVAAWDDVMTNCPDQLTQTVHYPPRFRVENLPDHDLIRSFARPLEQLRPF